MSPKVQMIIVIVILIAVAGWIIWKLFSKDSGAGSPCRGCSLSESCSKKSLRSEVDKEDC